MKQVGGWLNFFQIAARTGSVAWVEDFVELWIRSHFGLNPSSLGVSRRFGPERSDASAPAAATDPTSAHEFFLPSARLGIVHAVWKRFLPPSAAAFMPAAPLPLDESARLEALRRSGIVGSAPEAVYDDLTRRAAEVCGTPMALISLVEEKRQWFKSRVGIDLTETPRDQSFCAYALHTPHETLVVPDVTADPRFVDNPLVMGEPGLRFYAGAPLRSPEGLALGTLCVLDRKPRQLSSEQLNKLNDLAQQVSIRLALWQRARAEWRLTVTFGLVLTLLFSIGLFGGTQAARFLSSDHWVEHTNQVIHAIEESLFQVQAAESSQRGYTSTGRDAFLPPAEAAVSLLPERLARPAQADRRQPGADRALRPLLCRRRGKTGHHARAHQAAPHPGHHGARTPLSWMAGAATPWKK